MAIGRIKRAYFWTINHTINHLTLRIARSGHGPFVLVRHVGRKSGKTFETPILHARAPEGFVAVLVYGTGVSWYRNLRAAGHGVVVRGAHEYEIDGIERYPTEAGLRAFALPFRVFFKATRRSEFRLLHIAAAA
jgi:deazaflavin-dependent oxidoreductase (nitroreductase family)